MRAFAVLMMVQGHTIDTLLAEESRTLDSYAYSFWHLMRGFTAPIFMFTAGTVFTYLLRQNNKPFAQNPRVKKGFKRFALLLGIGYLLRYPTAKVIDFSGVTEESWLIFFASDALHLIAFGILFLLIFLYLSEKIKLRFGFILATASIAVIFITPYIISVNWKEIVPLPVAAYLYRETGSLFPFFPWISYVLLGGLLGEFLAHNPGVHKSIKFSFYLLGIGFIFISLSVLIDQMETFFSVGLKYSVSRSGLFCFRLGVVLVLNGIISFSASRLSDIPKLINDIGKNTLVIYVVHLIILYGCAWFPGLYLYFAKSLNTGASLGAAVFMLMLMTSMIFMIQRLKKIRTRLITVNR
jgi:uncharacterized membrane protein